MAVAPARSRRRAGPLFAVLAFASTGMGTALLSLLIAPRTPQAACPRAAAPSAGPPAIGVGAATGGERVGATEYGGPGDPSSGTVGASGINLDADPDSFAELGGTTFQTATALGGLPYQTPLRISWGAHSAVAYKRDIGLGGGPVDGLPRTIDLWWRFAAALGIPYEDGRWSGTVRISRLPASGAAGVLGQSPAADPPPAGGCTPAASTAVSLPLTTQPRAQLLPDGQAAAPTDAPAAVRAIIAAGNQIVGKPYVYGGGHGLPLDAIAPAYDCSSSVEHLLYGGGLLPVDYDAASVTLESFGRPGPGRWVTIYASADHVFMYVAGLRWDTHNAAGPGDGSSGIGWHPLIRSAAGFVARHPAGL